MHAVQMIASIKPKCTALLLLIFILPLGAQTYRLSTGVDKKKVHIYDPLLYSVTIDYHSNYNEQSPLFTGRLGSFYIQDFSRTVLGTNDQGVIKRRDRYTLLPEETGKLEIPRYESLATLSNEEIRLESASIEIEVLSLILGKDGLDIVENQNPVSSPGKILWPRLLLFSGVVLILLAAIVLLIIWLKRKKEQKRMSPAEEALWQLEQLSAEKLAEADKQKEIYAYLTLVIRNFFERSRNIKATAMTSRQVLRALSTEGSEWQSFLSEVMPLSDKVKFAKQTVTTETCLSHLSQLKKLIEQEKQQEENRGESE